MPYGAYGQQAYGSPLAPLAGQAADFAAQVQSMGLAANREQRAAADEQRAQWEFAQQQRAAQELERIKADWAASRGDLRAFMQTPGGMALGPEKGMQIAKYLQGMEEQTAQRNAFGAALEGVAAPAPEDFMIQGGPMAVRETVMDTVNTQEGKPFLTLPVAQTRMAQGVVPLESTRAAMGAYEAADADTAGLRSLAPMARAGALDNNAGEMFRLIAGLPGQRIKERAQIQADALARLREENRYQQGLLVEEGREERADQRARTAEEDRILRERIAEEDRLSREKMAEARIAAMLAKAGGAGAAGTNPDVEAIAQAIAQGKLTLDSFGKRNQQWTASVVKRVLEIRPDYDFTAASADVNSYRTLQRGADAVKAFKRGAEGGFKIIERLAENYKRGKYPGVNRWQQVLAYYAGDPEIKAFRNAVKNAMTEYMKVITAGTNISSAELSVAAQARTEEMLAAHDNPEALMNELAVYRAEMEAKGTAFDEQLREINTRRQGAGGQGTPGAGGAGPARATGRSTAPAIGYVDRAASRAEAVQRLRELRKQGWTEEELKAISSGTRWK